MSKVLSSNNLAVFDELHNELKLHVFHLKLLSDTLLDDNYKNNQNEILRSLCDTAALLEQDCFDFDVLKHCLQNGFEMNSK